MSGFKHTIVTIYYNLQTYLEYFQCRAFACDVMAAMLVYLDKRILNIFFWKYTNMAAKFFVVLIPRDWVKTLYTTVRGNKF